MRKAKYIFTVALVLGSSLFASQPSPAKECTDIAVVVNAANPVNDLSLPELRKMLTGDRRFWKGNVQVKLVLRAPGSREREVVLSTLLKIGSKEFNAQWRAKVFRGEASDEPLSVSSAHRAEQYLLANPGGITFITAKNPLPNLKVIRLEGKLPGDAGYVLK